jgi:protease II
MRLITLIFLLIAPSFVAAELRWICIAEDITHTNFFEGSNKLFEKHKPQDFIFNIKLTGNNDKIDISRHKEPTKDSLSDCLITNNTSFQCHAPENRNIMFYFDYISERFLYSHNTFAVSFTTKMESYMVGGYCSELY